MKQFSTRLHTAVSGVVLLASVGCSRSGDSVAPSSAPERTDVVAQVGTTFVTVEQMNHEVSRRQEQLRPMTSMEDVLADVVLTEALRQRAEAIGLADDPQVRRELDRLLIGKLLDRELNLGPQELDVSEDDLRAEYAAQRSTYTKAAQFRLSLIQLKGEKLMSEEKQRELASRLQAAREQLLSTGPVATRGFSGIAKKTSDHTASRHRDGDIGWWSMDQLQNHLPLAVMQRGAALKVGEVSEVFLCGDSYYLVAKTDARPERVTPFERVAPALRRTYLVEYQNNVRERYFESVRQQAGVTIFSNRLAQMDQSIVPSSPSPANPTTPFGVSGNL